MKIDPMYKKLGESIRWHREQAGLTQYELADAIGCTRPSIQMMERGAQRIHLDVLKRIATATHVTVASLLPYSLFR